MNLERELVSMTEKILLFDFVQEPTQCTVGLNEAFYLGSKQVYERLFMPLLPNAQKLLFTKIKWCSNLRMLP